MDFDFADLLLEVLERRASDLHITAGSPPDVRVRGRLTPLEDYPVARRRTDTREIIYSILTNDQRQRLETDWQLDFAYAIPGAGPLPRQRLLPARRARRGVPPDPVRDHAARRPRACRPSSTSSAKKPRGLVLVTGPTGSGKSTSLASMIDEINEHARGAHHDHRGPDRVPAPHKKCIVNQRELGSDAQSLRARPEGARCARTPT